jgi:hypothetical protein
MVSAASTPGQLSSGSPMPMNTMFDGLSAAFRRRTSRTCPAISKGVRFRRNPISPVAQNTQPSAQPACEEMQSVRRPPEGISTDSTASPSSSRQRNFCVPSLLSSAASTARRRSGSSASSASRSAAGSSVASFHATTGCIQSRRISCSVRKRGSPRAVTHAASRARASGGAWSRIESAGFSADLVLMEGR